MSKEVIKWVCKECGNETLKMQGRCFACGAFNSLEETTYFTGKEKAKTKSSKTISGERRKAVPIGDVEDGALERGFSSGIGEFDRVCGGKITEASVTLLGGDPGSGKSTLLTSVCNNVSQTDKILYISGEESEYQIKNRVMKRMGIKPNDNFNVLFSNDIDVVESETLRVVPKLLVVDSLNTLGSSIISGDPGDVSQMKHCVTRLVNLAKENGITIMCISQVTKDGELAGPRRVEHMVDTVLHLEGDEYNDLRFCRVTKNRFGQSVIGCFRMTSTELAEVPDPSEYLLKDRPLGESGSVVVCVNDVRPLLIEVQSLITLPPHENASPRRTSEGFSRNRLNLLSAVLEKKSDASYLTAKDIYVNVVGGISLKDPSTDLGVAIAMYSSNENKAMPDNTVVIGEVGLAGEVRPVLKIDQLIAECVRSGFEKCVLPQGNLEAAKEHSGSMELIPVKNLDETIRKLFK